MAREEFNARVKAIRTNDPRYRDVPIENEEQLIAVEAEVKILARARELMSHDTAQFDSIDREKLMTAFSYYMRYMPLHKIADNTGLSQTFLETLIFEKDGWKEQRAIAYKEATATIRMLSMAKLKETIATGLDLVNSSLKSLKQECDAANQAPSLIEAERIAGILLKLYKAQLIDGAKGEDEKQKAAETLPPSAIIEALGSDPYIQEAMKNLTAPPSEDVRTRNGRGDDRPDS